MARIKPNPYLVTSRDQAEATLAEIAALERKMDSVNINMNAAIDAAKERASAELNPLLTRRKELADGLAMYATLNREELFGKGKSIDLGFGVIGFRVSTSIVQLRGVTKEMTLGLLLKWDLTDAIRIKKEVDKEAMQGWPDERLELVGCKRQCKDAFYIEIAKEAGPQDV